MNPIRHIIKKVTAEGLGFSHPQNSIRHNKEINRYFKNIFPHRQEYSLADTESALSLHFLYPSEAEPFFVLHTTGMSRLPLSDAARILPDYEEQFRSELMLFLPPTWALPQGNWTLADLPADMRWPLDLLLQIARLPQRHEAWVNCGFTMPNGEDWKPYAPGVGFCGCTLICFEGNLGEIPLEDGSAIPIYMLVPLYEDEMSYGDHYGYEVLLERIVQVTGGSFILNPARPCSVEPWEI